MILGLKTYAQLSFCTGNSGDPIFVEDFGAGAGFGSLPIGTTEYNNANGRPNDGSYAISSSSNGWFNWHNINDHTEGDTNGRMLIINADPNPGEFYVTQINGLCENTSYEFSSWMINLLPSNHNCNPKVPINVRFEIWDNTDTNILASGDTGNIGSTSSPNWEQYALVFKTVPGQSSVILKMRNNGAGGCGNDLAIDDIMFRTCGDTVIIEDSFNNTAAYVCEDEVPFSTTLAATPDFTIFSSHFYQWQESIDGINWLDIAGENSQNYTTPLINNTTFYRVIVAEDAINLTNSSCNSSSEIFEVNLITFPNIPISNGSLGLCENDTTPLTVMVPNGINVNWYDAQTGGNLLQSNSNSFSPMVSGTYYAEAETINGNCLSLSRTQLNVSYFELPEVEDEDLEFCENITARLNANVLNPNVVTTYLWNTGETSEFIDVVNAGTYTVEVFNNTCSVTKMIELNQIDNPVISSVESDGDDIIVTTTNTGDFEFSLDGNFFQSSNVFSNIDGGLYSIYIKERNCTEIITTQHLHFYIPKFFTPNGDNENDTFNLAGIEYYNSSSVSIFDRYGKLLKNSRNAPFSWDGTFAGNTLPTGDYWYVIIVNDQKTTGHFTLKR